MRPVLLKAYHPMIPALCLGTSVLRQKWDCLKTYKCLLCIDLPLESWLAQIPPSQKLLDFAYHSGHIACHQTGVVPDYQTGVVSICQLFLSANCLSDYTEVIMATQSSCNDCQRKRVIRGGFPPLAQTNMVISPCYDAYLLPSSPPIFCVV